MSLDLNPLSAMKLSNMLHHITLTHPSLHADTIAALLRALEWRWMVSLQMHGEEFLHLKRVGPGLLTAFARTVEANSPALGTGDDIVVADDVLLKVVFALEAVLATILATMWTWISCHYALVYLLVSNKVCYSG